MGTAYKGSLLEWIDQHGGATYSADQLFQMAQAEGKDYPYDKIRSARNVRRGVTIVLGPNGVPLRGDISKQQKERPPLQADERARPGYFTNARAKPEAPPPVPKKLGRPSNADIRARVKAVGDAMHAPKAKPAPDVGPEVIGVVSTPPAPAVDPRQGALDLGLRSKQPTAVAEPVPRAPKRAVRARTQPEPASAELAEHEELPPAKHTALRKLILDVGLDTARQIIEEFVDVSERIR